MQKIARMRLLLIGSLTFLYFGALGQISVDHLHGHWKEVKRTLKSGETGRNVTLDGKDYVPKWDLIFNADGTCHDLQNDFKHSFAITEDKLMLGNSQYLIRELTKTKLVLTDYNPRNPGSAFAFIHYFEKVE